MTHTRLESPNQFSKDLLNWFKTYGRKDLPWQQDISPYRVWVSEIMLQQTQVTTVIPYFQRFIQYFPDVKALAYAKEDEVLHLWTGLGYYARARNLHKTAKIISQQYDGQFPKELELLIQLPGIGRSTAGAILSIALNKSTAILDGNVKRVLTRFHAIKGWPGEKKIEQQLWQLAEKYTPKKKFADYTQAIMDLGATICTRTKPLCSFCPMQHGCLAYQLKQAESFPTPKPRKQLPVRKTQFLLLRNAIGETLLIKRPPIGIWGGLWSLPECPITEDIHHFCDRTYGLLLQQTESWQTFRHTFTHFHLDITPVFAKINGFSKKIMDSGTLLWYNLHHNKPLGFPAPVKQLLEILKEIS